MGKPLSAKALRVVLRTAANMIERGAEAMRESCRGGVPEHDWACDDCPARVKGQCRGESEYATEMATVALLRDAARNGK